MKFKELLQSTFKSADTEENIDIYYTRPCGLILTLFYKRLGIHPNTVSVISIVLGMSSAYFFYHTDLLHNIIGIILLNIANFHDSADGQLARMTGKTSLIGRILDGASSDFIFFALYWSIVFRLYNTPIPFTDIHWGVGAFFFCLAAGLLGHSRQALLADYYRQIHLFVLKGKDKSELDTSEAQTPLVEKYRNPLRPVEYIFFLAYRRHCRRQEDQTPWAQKFLKAYPTLPEPSRQAFLEGSRPLMKYTNFLTYNWRSIFLYIGSLLNIPWLYPLLELTLFAAVLVYMRRQHESLCRRICEQA
ncbi:MAG: CDP-alcohol phosphatidyltransferase family protein [Bacteroidaceae bacterium]|nr:CDP-alcohol phosphatidyltransferase family protein [Bacteroidaceae bacterium]